MNIWNQLETSGTTRTYLFHYDVVHGPLATYSHAAQHKFESNKAELVLAVLSVEGVVTVRPTQVFHMILDLKDGQTVGCILADESTSSDETHSFFYAIPWRPDLKFENLDVVLAGEKRGAFTEFPLHFNGQIFIQLDLGLRLALHDPLSPQDFRGLPFLRSFPYIGGRQAGMIFTGVTAQFGRHSTAKTPERRVG